MIRGQHPGMYLWLLSLSLLHCLGMMSLREEGDGIEMLI